MALFARLVGSEEPKLPVHQFMAALSELARGQMTRAEIVTAFDLTVAEDADLGLVIQRAQQELTVTARLLWLHELEQVLILAEGGLRYTTASSARLRLGA